MYDIYIYRPLIAPYVIILLNFKKIIAYLTTFSLVNYLILVTHETIK